MAEPLVNPAYFDAIKEQIDTVFDCADLQELTNEVMQAIADQLNGIAAQMGLLLPLQALLQLPTNPNEIIDYLDTLVNALVGPLIEPFFVYQQQVIEIMAQVQEITDLLQYKSSILGGCGGGVLIPSLPNVDINLGGIIGGIATNPTSNISTQLLGFSKNLNSALVSLSSANQTLTLLQNRITTLENTPTKISELTDDPPSPVSGQTWVKKSLSAEAGDLGGFIGILPVIYDADQYQFLLSVQTSGGIKRVEMT